jgi:flagellin
MKGRASILSATLGTITINGTNITVGSVMAGDSNGVLLSSINDNTSKTGVKASIGAGGRLLLNSVDGRAIVITQPAGTGTDKNDKSIDRMFGISKTATNLKYTLGRLSLVRNNSTDIVLSSAALIGFGAGEESEARINLNSSLGTLTSAEADAAGLFANDAEAVEAFGTGTGKLTKIGGGLLTLRSAMMVMDVVETSLQRLGSTRSDIGSVQQQLEVAIRNISTMQVNVKASESQIRDVDFAEESSRFTKNNILAQAGSYALTQSNQLSNLALKLLQ